MKKIVNKNDLEIDFPSMLRNFRVKAGLTQRSVGKVLGYNSPQFVSNWERGISEPPVETLAKIAILYGVPLDVLLEAYIQFRLRGLESHIRAKIPQVTLKKSA